MKCAKCGIELDKAPLSRVNEKGVAGIFWCEMCIKENGLPYDENHFHDINVIHNLTHKEIIQ